MGRSADVIADQVLALPATGVRAGEFTMLEVSRILTALGAVLASVAFVVYGIAHSVRHEPGWELQFGIWGMIIGTIACVVGLVMHHNLAEEADDTPIK